MEKVPGLQAACAVVQNAQRTVAVRLLPLSNCYEMPYRTDFIDAVVTASNTLEQLYKTLMSVSEGQPVKEAPTALTQTETVAELRQDVLDNTSSLARGFMQLGLDVLETGTGVISNAFRNPSPEKKAHCDQVYKVMDYMERVCRSLNVMDPVSSFLVPVFITALAGPQAEAHLSRRFLHIKYIEPVKRSLDPSLEECIAQFQRNAKFWDLQWTETRQEPDQQTRYRAFTARIDMVRFSVLFSLFSNLFMSRGISEANTRPKLIEKATTGLAGLLATLGKGQAQAIPRNSAVYRYLITKGSILQKVFEHEAEALLKGFFESLTKTSFVKNAKDELFIMTATDSPAELKEISTQLTGMRIPYKNGKYHITKKPALVVDISNLTTNSRLLAAFLTWVFTTFPDKKTEPRERLLAMCEPVDLLTFEEYLFDPVRIHLKNHGIPPSRLTFKVLANEGPVLAFTINGLRADERTRFNDFFVPARDQNLFGPLIVGEPYPRYEYDPPYYSSGEEPLTITVYVYRWSYEKDFGA